MMLRGWKIVVLTLPLLAFGCGKPAQFQKQDYSAVAVAGQYTKPKIDVVIFQDNSLSMQTPNSIIKGQLNNFVTGLSSSWDFRFIVLPLQAMPPMNSKYVLAKDCTGLTGFAACLNPSQLSSFINAPGDYGFINSLNGPTGNTDLGFQNIKGNMDALSVKAFARPDAALAVVVVSNGEDVSGVGYSDPDGDGHFDIDYNSSTSINSFNYYKSYLSNLTTGTSLLKFYSVVAAQKYADCYGGSTFQGYRYMQMSTQLGSSYFNLCSNGLTSALGDIGAQINSLIASIVFNYAVINEAPIASSIIVKKNGATIPQSAINGWTYEGPKTNFPTSYKPQLGNNKTGYFIKLNGTAEYSGTDVITVDYQKQ